MELRDKRVLVVGAARSGIASARFLATRGAAVTVSDRRPLEQIADAKKLTDLPVTIEAGRHTTDTFTAQDLIVVSPGVPADLPELEAARRAGVRIIPEIELAWTFLKGRTIAVTGSNGKTTTTALIGHLLAAAGFHTLVGGNIGTALASQIEQSTPATWHVAELSSFQLETIDRFRPAISVVLNVTPDHLDRHHTFEAYARAKSFVFKNQTGKDFAILNADDETCRGFARHCPAQVMWFNRQGPAWSGANLEHGNVIFRGALPSTGGVAFEQTILGVEEIPLKGAHNVENVLAAVCAAMIAGAQPKAVRQGVRSFQAVEHRLEFVATVNGVDYYNDSKATNVDATIKALQSFPGNLLVILGGRDKGSDYRTLWPLLQEKAKAVLLIGEASDKIAAHLAEAAAAGRPVSVPVLRAVALENALNEAYGRAAQGDVVLLAPACASFDQFESYEHRGRVFKELVHGLKRRTPGTR